MRKKEKSESEIAVTLGGNSDIQLGTAKIFVSEDEYVYVTSPCERGTRCSQADR